MGTIVQNTIPKVPKKKAKPSVSVTTNPRTPTPKIDAGVHETVLNKHGEQTVVDTIVEPEKVVIITKEEK